MPSQPARHHFQPSHFLVATTLAIVALAPQLSSATVIADVPAGDRYGYTKIYQFTPTTTQNWHTSTYYSIDNSGTPLPDGFSRIGYYMELQIGAGARQWIWASMDAFTTQLNRIGVPRDPAGFSYQQFVNNMTVRSNVGSIVTGTGIATGNIEFWPNNYAGTNSLPVPNASGTAYDFGDQPAAPSAGYGSMQIHNYDLDGAGIGLAGQTLFGYSGWGGYTGDLGIGNNTGSTDWTLTNNAASYTLRNIEIWVLDNSILVPEPSGLTLLSLGLVGLAVKTRRRRRRAAGQ